MTQRPAGCESCGGHCAQDAAERAAARQAPLLCAACQLEDDDMYCDEALDDASQLQQYQQYQQHQQQHHIQLQEEQQQLQQQTTAPATPGRKRVRWSTITVHEFGVALGGSAVSNKGGPSIGLADAPEFTWTTKVGEMAECSEGVHRFSPAQRVRLLQAAGVSDGMIERHAKEASIILGSRRRTFLEDLAEERKEKSRKRNAEQATLERPCAVALRRPRMIPANYV